MLFLDLLQGVGLDSDSGDLVNVFASVLKNDTADAAGWIDKLNIVRYNEQKNSGRQMPSGLWWDGTI